MSEQVLPSSYFGEMLKYFEPFTNWQSAFSPILYFGCNVGDKEVEHHVLNKVGSYGSQINRIMDVVSVLVETHKGALTDDQREAVEEFNKLATKADEAAATYQGKQPRKIKFFEVEAVIKRIRKLKEADRDQYDKVISALQDLTGESAKKVVST